MSSSDSREAMLEAWRAKKVLKDAEKENGAVTKPVRASPFNLCRWARAVGTHATRDSAGCLSPTSHDHLPAGLSSPLMPQPPLRASTRTGGASGGMWHVVATCSRSKVIRLSYGHSCVPRGAALASARVLNGYRDGAASVTDGWRRGVWRRVVRRAGDATATTQHRARAASLLRSECL
jgi:hypothetical protein